MDLKLVSKFALVTGGSHGIGKSIALSLAEEGCNIAICSRDKDRIEETVEEIISKGVCGIGIIADVTIPNDIDRVINTVTNSWNTVHILINNVGGGGRWGSENIEETEEQVWLDVYNKNALSAIRFTTKLIPYMRKQKWGRVITISSIYGKEGGGRPWFNMAKSSEISLMKTLAMTQYLVRDGITFNSVAPGNIMIPDTGWDRESKENPDKFRKILEEKPLGRLGTPDEVANMITFLCSEKASFVNGTCIAIDGGESRSF